MPAGLVSESLECWFVVLSLAPAGGGPGRRRWSWCPCDEGGGAVCAPPAVCRALSSPASLDLFVIGQVS